MFFKNNYKYKKGFTLIELLVVISIIALLLAILLPSLNKARMLALRVKCSSNLKQINIAMNMYSDENNNFYPAGQDPVNPPLWLWMGRGFRPFIEPYLSMERGEKNASVLICPSDKKSTNLYDDTSYGYSMCFYHSEQQIDSLSTTDDQKVESNVLPTIPQKPGNVKQPAKKIITGEWYSNHKQINDDKGWWCSAGARNFIFADGHTEYLASEKIAISNDGYPNPNLTKNGVKGSDIAE